VAVLPGVSDVFQYFLVSIKLNSFRTFCFQIEKEKNPIVGEEGVSFSMESMERGLAHGGSRREKRGIEEGGAGANKK
jgi:hypothetical protein